jgi:HPt (histidine-containing phosphotransfer) domain-containing protein
MDCQMPDMDGYEVTARVRALEAGRDRGGATGRTPIIAMTGSAMPDDRQRCLAAGMDDYLSKPVRIEDLAAALDRWMPSPLPDPGGDGRSIDWEHFEELRRMCKSQELRQIVSLLLEETERRIGDLQAAVVAGAASEIEDLAHSVKGSTGMFGAVALSKLAEALEEAGQRSRLEEAGQLVARLRAEFERTRAAFLEALVDAAPR